MPMVKIVPAAYNPRKNLTPKDPEYQKLKRSMEKFGYVEPIVFNERTGRVIGGHQRLKVLQEAGETEVTVSVVDLPETEEKALNIALNKISGDWDMPLLKDLLEELDTGAFDMDLTGFDADEIERLMAQFHVGGATEEKKVPPVPEVPITQKGDLWLLGRHRVMCGDSLATTDVDKLFNGETADSIVTDPPHGVDYSGKNEFLNAFDKGNCIQTPISNDAIKDYRKFFSEFLVIAPLTRYNTIYVFMSSKELHSLRLALDDCKITWGDYLVWVKNNHVLGRKDYNAKYEFIVYGWKGHHKFYGPFSTTVLNYDKPLKNDLHPTMKPVEIVTKLVTDGTRKNGLVYDPFGGSGSTLIASEQTGRRCYMMELMPGYCDVIVKRWENLTGQKAILQGE